MLNDKQIDEFKENILQFIQERDPQLIKELMDPQVTLQKVAHQLVVVLDDFLEKRLKVKRIQNEDPAKIKVGTR
jgi:uncharacterized membrane-anchored protein